VFSHGWHLHDLHRPLDQVHLDTRVIEARAAAKISE
jgi:hypothetical protein